MTLMKKLLGLSLVPVVLAMSIPAMSASPTRESEMTTTTTETHMTETRVMDAHHMAAVSIYGTEAHNLYTQAQWQLVERNYPEAIRLFENVLAITPDHVPSLHGLAIAHEMRGEYVDAIKNVNQAISLDPVNSSLLLTKARILDAQKMDVPALDAYLTFLSWQPMDSQSIEVQRRADDIFNRVQATLTPEQKDYFTGLRILSMDRPDEAIQSLQRFVDAKPMADNQPEITPEVVNAQLLISLAHQRLNQPEQAVAELQQLSTQAPIADATPEIAPLKARLYFELSNNYGLTGQKQEARDAWTSFVRFAPKSEASGVLEQPFLR